jgi:hypothetical protein
MGPSVGFSMPVKKEVWGRCSKNTEMAFHSQRNNMNDGNGNSHIPEDSTAGYQN